jgi:hypothetical protein
MTDSARRDFLQGSAVAALVAAGGMAAGIGAAAAKYIDAFFANIDWDTVSSRL